MLGVNRSWMALIAFLAFCLFPTPAQAGQTTTYRFLPGQSTIIQTGGIAGIHRTYTITGTFVLSLDFEAGTASFDRVDAKAVDDGPNQLTLDPNEVFNMTELAGTIIDRTTIRFEGTADDGSSVLVTLSFTNDSVALKGGTTPPPNSADFFIFTLDAQAAQAGQTSTYVFDPNRSTVLKTGGFAGVHITYALRGRFQLTVDSGTGGASFGLVDASLVDEKGSVYGLNLNEIFNLTGLAGTVIDDATIEFAGKTADGTESDVRLRLALRDDSAHLTGGTTPPPNSADMFFYDIDAIATKKYAGGTGEPNDPYQIATAADLIALGETPEDYDKHFILTADIDLDPNLPGRKVFDRAVIAPDMDPNTDRYGYNAYDGTAFSGAFDGNDHTISHLMIDGGDYLGLFGGMDSGAKIKNLGVVYASVTGSGSGIAVLVGVTGVVEGFNFQGSITRCYSSGRVSGVDGVGGLVGSNLLYIINCYSNVEVTGDWIVGGLVGDTYLGEIIQCYSIGPVRGSWLVGGLIGANGWAVTQCYSTGTVSGDQDVGGLVGSNGAPSGEEVLPGEVTACYSTGEVDGNECVGGLVGQNDYGSVADSYATGRVRGARSVGGLVGYNAQGTAMRCYSTGMVSGDSSIGGLVGYTEKWSELVKTFMACFWDIDKSGQVVSDGGMGKTTAEMQMASTFLDAGWDFVGEVANGTADIWSICEGTNYPRLIWQVPAGDFVCPDGIAIEDFVFFIEHWLNGNCDEGNDWCDGADLDKSGVVDAKDLEIFLDNWRANSQ